MAELAWGAATHPGQLRPQNEDNILAIDGIYVVADGMGGHEAGEVASQIAVERVLADLEGNTLPDAFTVVKSISNANSDILRAAIANPGQAGMGTTVTAIAVIADRLAGRGAPNLDVNDDPGEVTPILPAEPSEAMVLANVGDSRAYLLRHGRLRRISVDHSYVQELVSTGHITEEEARHHPRRNIITRALGIEPDVKVDWWTLPLIRGDRFLLCSDGLVDEVDDRAIGDTLRTLDDPQAAADRLVQQANDAGGRDNISVIVLDVLEGDEPPDPTQELDAIPIWPNEEDPTPAGSLQVDADGTPAGGHPPPTGVTTVKKRRLDRGPRRFVIGFAIGAVLVTGFVFFAAWARSGYFVAFDSDTATIYRGRTDGVLWFDPTVENRGAERDALSDESIERVEDRPRFGSLSEAAGFLSGLEPAPTTTTTSSTTTSSTTTSSTTTSSTTTSSTTTRTVAPTTTPTTTNPATATTTATTTGP